MSSSSARTISSLAEHREEIVRRMEQVMGPLPGPERRVDLAVQYEEETDCGTYVRRLLTYQSEPGSRVPAYLLVPKELLNQETGAQRQAHGILCLHQTHAAGQKVVVGLGNSPNDEHAVELVKRGFVCLAPPYQHLANYAPDLQTLGYQSGTMKAIWDNIRALDLLESLPYVQRGSFGAIGHSLGGHNGLFTAAFDLRIKVVVTSCGFDSFRDYMDGNIRGWTSERYMPRLLEYAPDRFPFDFNDVLAAIAPRTIFISAPKGDSNFQWRSVDRMVAMAAATFQEQAASGRLIVEHPDVGHLFPAEVRKRAYEVIARALSSR